MTSAIHSANLVPRVLTAYRMSISGFFLILIDFLENLHYPLDLPFWNRPFATQIFQTMADLIKHPNVSRWVIQ